MLRRLLLLAGGGGGFTEVTSLPVNNVENFGAVHDGTTDDATAINAAIAALPVTGGIVYFPAGTYAIGSSITIGNGSGSAASTRRGVWLMGAGVFGPMGLLSYPAYAEGATILKWTGGASPMVWIKGPLGGWGITDIGFDGQSTATAGLRVTSATHGFAERLGIIGCANSLFLTSVAPSGGLAGAVTGTFHNTFDQIAILMPDTFSIQTGLYLNADSTATGSGQGVFFNRFSNVFIQTTYPTSNEEDCLRLVACDNNRFNELHLAGTGAGNCYAIRYVYGVSNWPSDNTIDGISFGTSSAGKITKTGSSSGSPNRIVNIAVADGRPADPALTDLAWGYVDSDP